MAAIRGKNTLPERALRSALFAVGLRFRLHARSLPGSPDIVFPKFKAVVFVHGCFWHRHLGCRFAAVPKTNAEFWAEKFATNVRRDQSVRSQLRELGWRVGIAWECSIQASPESTAKLINTWLHLQESWNIDIGAAGKITLSDMP